MHLDGWPDRLLALTVVALCYVSAFITASISEYGVTFVAGLFGTLFLLALVAG